MVSCGSLARVFLAAMLAYVAYRTHPTLFTSRELLAKDEFDLVYGPWGVVLGASEGIGLEWAFALGERGVNVVMVGRDREKLKEAHESIRRAIPFHTFLPMVMDLDNVTHVREAMSELAKQVNVGIVVYNAAYSPVGKLTSYKTELHERAINVNVHSPLVAVSSFIPAMVERRRGAVVLMSSVDGEGCNPYVANYAATKAWNTRFAESLWYELKPHNVTVLGVVAGLTSTPSLDGVLNPQIRERLKPFIESKPREVVMESLAALGRDSPIVITGLATKLVALMHWILPRFLVCELGSQLESMIKSPEELRAFAEATAGSAHSGGQPEAKKLPDASLPDSSKKGPSKSYEAKQEL